MRWPLGFLSVMFGTCLGVVHACAQVQELDVDLELVLAVDVSRSMDFEEQRLQREGYIAAFRHPEVVQAIEQGPLGRIAVTYFEWAGNGFQTMIVPWMPIANAAEADAFATLLEAAPQMRERGTSISSGLEFAGGLFGRAFSGYRQTIDVSGDGPNNMGQPVVPARDALVRRGITINGLPIMLRPSYTSGAYGIPNLDVYYEDCVIGGPGAFMVTVKDVAEFPAAIRRKLVLEIAGVEPVFMRAAEITRVSERVDCMIGEKSRGNWMFGPGGR